jgi:solute carrier family 25 (mitochondrial carnitine/acylcarnitine transporter), member 20/29
MSSDYLHTLKATIAGLFAGVLESVVEYPFDVVKTRIQTITNDNSYQCARKMLKEEGIKSFYYGYTARIWACAASGGLLFGSNEYFKMKLNVNKDKLCYNFFLASFLTGCVEAVVYTPLDLVKSRMQIKLYGDLNFRANANLIYQKEGIAGFYRGLILPTIFKEGIGNCFYFGTYKIVSTYLKNNNINPWISTMIAGGCAGSMYWVIYPIDTIKTLKQTENKLAPKNMSSLSCAINIIKQEGFCRLYRGYPSVLVRAWPANVTLFCGYESMNQILCI